MEPGASIDQEMAPSSGTAMEMIPDPPVAALISQTSGSMPKVARADHDTSNHKEMFETSGSMLKVAPPRSHPWGDHDTSNHEEVCESVVRYLSVKSLGRAMCVCKSWKAVAASEEGLWHRHCALLYPALLSPAVSKQITETCGFHRFFLHRLLPPARAPKLPFAIDDLTFFLDISYHGSPVFSHVFRYGGGSAVVPYSPDCYVDSGAVFPSSDSLDKDAFRRTIMVNWTAIRRTDGKGTCIVRAVPDRSSSSSISFDALLAAVPSSKPGDNPQGSNAPPAVGAMAVTSPRPSAVQKTPSSSQLPALKLVFNTTLGGAVGAQFYGMMKVSFALPVRERFLQQKGGASGGGRSPSNDVTPVNVLSRSGGLEIDVSALKDRLGGTVRVDIADKEFLLILSALEWV